MTENHALELAPAELTIPLKVTLGNTVYRVRHLLRPPAADDWLAYDVALAMAIEEVLLRPDGGPDGRPEASDGAGAAYKLELHSVEAAALLWDRLARGIEGYSFAADANWHELVPLAHKEAAVRALTLVAPTDTGATGNGATFPLQAEQVPVVLEAVVAGRAYPRLVHIFRPPGADDERSYRRLLAETFIVRGSRTPRTLIPSRLGRLVKFYDALILSTEGYAANGQLLASREQVIQHMDAWHKRTAVQTLFGDATEPAPPVAGAFEEARP